MGQASKENKNKDCPETTSKESMKLAEYVKRFQVYSAAFGQ